MHAETVHQGFVMDLYSVLSLEPAFCWLAAVKVQQPVTMLNICMARPPVAVNVKACLL